METAIFQKSVEYFVAECIWLNHGEKQLETFGEITMMNWVLFNEDKLIEEVDYNQKKIVRRHEQYIYYLYNLEFY